MVLFRCLLLFLFWAASVSHAGWNNERVSLRTGRSTSVKFANNAEVLCRRMLQRARPNTQLDMKVGVGRFVTSFFHRSDVRTGSDITLQDFNQAIAERAAGENSPLKVSAEENLPDVKNISDASLLSLSELYATIYPRSLVDSIIKEEEGVLLSHNTAFMALSLPNNILGANPQYVSFIRHYDFGRDALRNEKGAKEHGLKGSPSPAEVALKLRGIESEVFKKYRRRRSILEVGKDIWNTPLDPEPTRIKTTDPHQVAWDPPIIPRGYKVKEVGRTFVDPKLKETSTGKEQYKEARRLQELWQEEVIEDDTYYTGHCSLASNEGFDLTISWGFGVLEKINVNKDPKGEPQWEYLMMVKGSDFKKALEAKRLAYEGKEKPKVDP